MTRLWHYTCFHGHEALGEQGWLRPTAMRSERMGRVLPHLSRLVWATDMPHPDRTALGLTMNVLTCDRTAYRYEVVETGAFATWTFARRAFHPLLVEGLESAPGVAPAHWWVSVGTPLVRYAPVVKP